MNITTSVSKQINTISIKESIVIIIQIRLQQLMLWYEFMKSKKKNLYFLSLTEASVSKKKTSLNNEIQIKNKKETDFMKNHENQSQRKYLTVN